jgi:hypothetical protein
MPDTLPFDPTAPKQLPKPGPRKALNRVQILQLAIRQKLLCGCGCGAALEPVCIDEHMVPRETLPADRCDHIDNRALLNPPCAKAKTKKDQAVIGHWRRARGDSGQVKRRKEKGSQIQSRPFPEMRLSRSEAPSKWSRKPDNYVSPLSKKHRDQVKARMER